MERFRPHLRGAEVIEEIEHALTKWSRYGVDMPRAVRLELCKVQQISFMCAMKSVTHCIEVLAIPVPVHLPFTTKPSGLNSSSMVYSIAHAMKTVMPAKMKRHIVAKAHNDDAELTNLCDLVAAAFIFIYHTQYSRHALYSSVQHTYAFVSCWGQ